MRRRDYDEIRKKVDIFAAVFQSRDCLCLESIVSETIHVYLSVNPARDGAEHSLLGLVRFFSRFPRTEKLNVVMVNYICRMAEKEAQSYFELFAQAGSGEKKFSFAAMFCCHWLQVEKDWRMDEIRMDINPLGGDLQSEFEKVWHFEERWAVLTPQVHLPCIFGEMDSPWARIPKADDVLGEEELIVECFCHLNYAIEQFSLAELEYCLSTHFSEREKYIEKVRFERQPLRYASRPYCLKELSVRDTKAKAVIWDCLRDRPAGIAIFEKTGEQWKVLNLDV